MSNFDYYLKRILEQLPDSLHARYKTDVEFKAVVDAAAKGGMSYLEFLETTLEAFYNALDKYKAPTSFLSHPTYPS